MIPVQWVPANNAFVGWFQGDFDPALAGPAVIQINVASDGSAHGEWINRGSIPGPLTTGVEAIEIPVADLEGRHQVRVVVPGALNSPLALGTLLLDRTPPDALDAGVRTMPDRFDVFWTQSDGGLSGTDPSAPTVVEMNTSPFGDEGGTWEPFLVQPGCCDGSKFARQPRAAVSEGVHLTRVRSTDIAGNTGARPLASLVNDNRPPLVDVRVVKAPTQNDGSFELAYTASDPQPGSGLQAGSEVWVTVPGGVSAFATAPLVAAGEGRVVGVLTHPGTYRLVVRVTDRVGVVGESAPVELALTVGPPIVREPSNPPPDIDVPLAEPIRILMPTRARPPLARSTRWAFASVRRFHARRGVPVRASVAAARTPGQWRRLLGTSGAGRYSGYATFSGEVLLSPSVTAGLDDLHRARLRLARNPRGPASRLPSRLELDRSATSLAVLLHETLHASGPVALEDYRTTASGRAFEEGFTEAATIDLLPRYVRSLGGNPRLERALAAAVRRYRPAYPTQVRTARVLSGLATGSQARSRPALRWRVMVADRWGTDRWLRLARATDRDESGLRSVWRDPVRTRR